MALEGEKNKKNYISERERERVCMRTTLISDGIKDSLEIYDFETVGILYNKTHRGKRGREECFPLTFPLPPPSLRLTLGIWI